MKIKSLHTNGVRGVPDRVFDFTDPTTGAPARRVVITGPAGSGKTRLLEAIVAAKEDVAPYSATRISVQPRPDAGVAKVTVAWALDPEDQQRLEVKGGIIESQSIFGGPVTLPKHDPKLRVVLARYSHDSEQGKIEYVPSSRSLGPEASGSSDVHPDEQKRIRLSRTFRKYAALPRYLSELGLGLFGAPRTRHFVETFNALARTVRCGGVRRSRAGVEFFFIGPNGVELSAEELSDFEQQALIFAGVGSLIGLDHSVVLVDTPELFVASGDGARFIEGLMALGRDDQWIFATKSAEIVTMPGTVVIELASAGPVPPAKGK